LEPYSISDYRDTSLTFLFGISEIRNRVTGEKGEWKYASEQLGAGAFYGAMRVFGARIVVLAIAKAINDKFGTSDTRNAAIGRSKRMGL
jgi:hypothetical protein